MRQVRIIATGATVSEAVYRSMHPQASWANVFTPFEDAELLAEVPDMPTVDEYTNAIQAMLDTKAREKRYDNILSACTYVTSTVPSFQAEGQACVEWRDAVWAESYDLMAQVQAGTLAQPTIPELLAMLPEMDWPA